MHGLGQRRENVRANLGDRAFRRITEQHEFRFLVADYLAQFPLDVFDRTPGKILQFTVAVADCGSAFSACPASSMVTTQVVRVVPT
jgi:hypothetical protein